MSATLEAPHNLQSLTDRPGIVRRIGAALRGAYSDRHAVKLLAQSARSDIRTAEAWLYGHAAPRSPELLQAMADNDQLEMQILALVREIRERRSCPKES